MHKFYWLGLLFLCLFLGIYVYKNYIVLPSLNNNSTENNFVIDLNKPKGDNFTDIEFTNSKLRIAWINISDNSNLSLFSNLPSSESAEKRIVEKSCKYLVNGGFYSKESRPIGVFISEGELITNPQKNNLFNGVFSVDLNNSPHITSNLNEKNVRFAVQSGPILISDGELQQVNLRADSPERRTVVALDDNSRIMFLTIYNPNSVYLGAHLADVPDILREFEKVKKIKLMFVLNLDGGTASAFYSDSVSLPELSSIGSYFCIK